MSYKHKTNEIISNIKSITVKFCQAGRHHKLIVSCKHKIKNISIDINEKIEIILVLEIKIINNKEKIKK